MQVQQEQDGHKGSFYVDIDGVKKASMTYTMSDSDLMIINHTEVDDELRGKNVGNQLLNAAVAYARANHLKIFPLCPFAKAVLTRKHDEYADVLRN